MTMRAWKGFVAGGLVLVAATATAQYKSIGADGRVTYSDTPPPPTAKVVEQKKLGGSTAGPALPFELQQAATRFPVTLYSGDKCAPCDEARSYLRARGVPFNEKTVTSDDDIALFKQQSPDGTAPVITVGSRKSVGFSQVALSSLLDSAGYPATSTLPRDYQNAVATPLSPNTKAPGQSVAQTPATPIRPSTTAIDATPAPSPPANPSGFRF
jgi:glutaredoxin